MEAADGSCPTAELAWGPSSALDLSETPYQPAAAAAEAAGCSRALKQNACQLSASSDLTSMPVTAAADPLDGSHDSAQSERMHDSSLALRSFPAPSAVHFPGLSGIQDLPAANDVAAEMDGHGLGMQRHDPLAASTLGQEDPAEANQDRSAMARSNSSSSSSDSGGIQSQGPVAKFRAQHVLLIAILGALLICSICKSPDASRSVLRASSSHEAWPLQAQGDHIPQQSTKYYDDD